MVDPVRLLGFAFANADLLFETDRDGKILFATGATKGISTQTPEALIGKSATRLFAPAAGKKFTLLSNSLNPGGRLGPVELELANGEKGLLSLCLLPPNKGRISCTLGASGNGAVPATGSKDPQTDLPDREAFLAAAETLVGPKTSLAVFEVPGLHATTSGLPAQASQKLLRGIAASLTSTGAKTVGRLSETSFGIIAESPTVTTGLAANIARAIRENGGGESNVEQAFVRLQTEGLTQDQALLALRHVVRKLVDDKSYPKPLNLGAAFHELVTEALERVTSFNKAVDDGTFAIVFDPIVNLKTGEISHYEALTRFVEGQSPAELIGFAEEMGLASAFDIAVASKVFATVAAGPKACASIGLNVSGCTVGTPAPFALFSAMLERNKQFAKRVHIEITESAEMTNLEFADKAIQTMRKMGFRVGLDDFGAGAASLQYLHALVIDFVKFDGSLVKRMGQSKRDDALLKSMIDTCESLEVTSIAEWIENESMFTRAKTLGFEYGQGRHFGTPHATAPEAPVAQVRPARRQGVQETWG